jgi:NAD(P)-dependent dehydrogenase (short-subunit alcohol dehydrogenase family)
MVAAQKIEETFTIAHTAVRIIAGMRLRRGDATGLACALAAERLDRRRLLGERRHQFVAPLVHQRALSSSPDPSALAARLNSACPITSGRSTHDRIRWENRGSNRRRQRNGPRAGPPAGVTNSRDEWERTFNICWGGVYNCVRAFLPMLQNAEEGHIVNTSSINGFWASVGPRIPHTAYSAANSRSRGSPRR